LANKADVISVAQRQRDGFMDTYLIVGQNKADDGQVGGGHADTPRLFCTIEIVRDIEMFCP
jgi:hypothetical protein